MDVPHVAEVAATDQVGGPLVVPPRSLLRADLDDPRVAIGHGDHPVALAHLLNGGQQEADQDRDDGDDDEQFDEGETLMTTQRLRSSARKDAERH